MKEVEILLKLTLKSLHLFLKTYQNCPKEIVFFYIFLNFSC